MTGNPFFTADAGKRLARIGGHAVTAIVQARQASYRTGIIKC